MFKNILFGLGSIGVVGGGGYMIYNATKSGDEISKTTENNNQEEGKSASSGDGQEQQINQPTPGSQLDQQQSQPSLQSPNTKK